MIGNVDFIVAPVHYALIACDFVCLCMQLTVYLDTHMTMPGILFEVTCQLLLCLLSSDDILVNATRRLADKTRCEKWLVSNMQHSCRAKQTGGHWSHFYSYCIRANASLASDQWCRTCAYSCLVATRLCAHIERGAEMIQRFQVAGLPLFLHPVPIENVNAVITFSPPVLRLQSTPRGLDIVSEGNEGEGEREGNGESDGAAGTRSEDNEYLFPIAPITPLRDGRQEWPLVAHRSIEYIGNVTVQHFDRSVFQLFQWFHIPYGPRTEAQRDYVSMAQKLPGPNNAFAHDIEDRIIE